MEENKKNNAVEKVENTEKRVAKKPKKRAKKPTPNVATEKAQKDLKKSIEEKRKAKRLKKEKLKRIRQEKKQEKEMAMAQRRIELARINAEKKKNKEKIKAQREKQREERRAERIEKINARKNETKQERIRRIKEERQEKLRIKRERQAQKAEAKRQREERRHERKRAKEQNKVKGYGGWLAAVVSLGIAVLVLSSVLTMTLVVPTVMDTEVGNVYSRSFYDTVSHVDNIDLDLKKAFATTDNGSMQKYLMDVTINSELAENDLAELPLKDECKYYTVKLINQIGDYSKYLTLKLIDGEKLSALDMENLNTLYNANKKLKEGLNELSQKLGEGYNFTALLEQNGKDVLVAGLTEMQNLSVELPELIYDGPFSDGKLNREIKGLPQEEISRAQAKEIFTSIFADYMIGEVMESGETTGKIETYNFTCEKDGAQLYAEISKKGGKLMLFDMMSECNELAYDKDECVEIGLNFINKLGLTNMRPVWASQAYGVATINYVYENNDIIYYPDMVKVTVCQETGMVTGYEASEYYYNHIERSVEKASVTKEQACEKLHEGMELLTCRLALIPVGEKEVLSYELCADYQGETYFVYINALTGKQAEMFIVIDSLDGQLLI